MTRSKHGYFVCPMMTFSNALKEALATESAQSNAKKIQAAAGVSSASVGGAVAVCGVRELRLAARSVCHTILVVTSTTVPVSSRMQCVMPAVERDTSTPARCVGPRFAMNARGGHCR